METVLFIGDPGLYHALRTMDVDGDPERWLLSRDLGEADKLIDSQDPLLVVLDVNAFQEAFNTHLKQLAFKGGCPAVAAVVPSTDLLRLCRSHPWIQHWLSLPLHAGLLQDLLASNLRQASKPIESQEDTQPVSPRREPITSPDKAGRKGRLEGICRNSRARSMILTSGDRILALAGELGSGNARRLFEQFLHKQGRPGGTTALTWYWSTPEPKQEVLVFTTRIRGDNYLISLYDPDLSFREVHSDAIRARSALQAETSQSLSGENSPASE